MESGAPIGVFDYDAIPMGYYHLITQNGTPIRRAWHLHKFERVVDCMPVGQNLSVLDVGCFAGTFLSLLPEDRFSRQVGVDILEKQITFANGRFRTRFREFRLIQHFDDLNAMTEQFDCLTLIEVIEHLSEQQIRNMFDASLARLKKGGKLIISTPNYLSTWPLLELVLNHFSEISYKEQHLTKFNYFSVERKLRRIFPDLETFLRLDFKTTTHFISPFLAAFSLPFARRVSRWYPHQDWHFPFGNLLLLSFTRI